MTLFKEWSNLLNGQTKETFPKFWEEYSNTEIKIYKDILTNHTVKPAGTVAEMVEKYQVKPVFFMGFLDGINTSLDAEMDLDAVDENTALELTIDFDRLLTNMFKANADHLYNLDEWKDVFTKEHYTEIYDEYRRSRTVVNEGPKIGRNDPCPCGSGKKYKKCCGRNL